MTNTPRPNRFAGRCSACGEKVAAGAGTLGPKVAGRWTTRCAAHSPAARPPRVAACDCGDSRCGGCDRSFDAMKDARAVEGTWRPRW